jgi:hypothetical protein
VKKDFNQEIGDLNVKLTNSANDIEVKVLKGVRVKFGTEIKDITQKIYEESKKLDLTVKRVSGSEQKLEHLKDIVSKKANFTDLIVETEKKANKIEFIHVKEQLE